MKKFKCVVTKTYEYEISMDDKIWSEENINNWASVFYEADNLEDMVRHLARMKVQHEDGEYIEGFGIPYINGDIPYLNNAEDFSYISPDINIDIITYEDVDVEVEEMNN